MASRKKGQGRLLGNNCHINRSFQPKNRERLEEKVGQFPKEGQGRPLAINHCIDRSLQPIKKERLEERMDGIRKKGKDSHLQSIIISIDRSNQKNARGQRKGQLIAKERARMAACNRLSCQSIVRTKKM